MFKLWQQAGHTSVFQEAALSLFEWLQASLVRWLFCRAHPTKLSMFCFVSASTTLFTFAYAIFLYLQVLDGECHVFKSAVEVEQFLRSLSTDIDTHEPSADCISLSPKEQRSPPNALNILSNRDSPRSTPIRSDLTVAFFFHSMADEYTA